MFKEIIFIASEDVYVKRSQYELIDDDFAETFDHPYVGSLHAHVSIVIEAYEKRNLNVAANLVRAFVWMNKAKFPIGLDTLILVNRDNHVYTKYADAVNRYLLLI